MSQKRLFLCVSGCIAKGSEVLVMKRAANDTYQPGYWEFPGGCLEWGESPEKALQREIQEETNLSVIKSKLYGIFTDTDEEGRHVVELAYHCQVPSLTELALCEEHEEYRWVTAEEIDKLKPLSQHFRTLFDAGLKEFKQTVG